MNCCGCPALRFADAGLTLMLVSVCFTITFTLLVMLRPCAGLTIVTSRLYVPAAPNVATVDWAAWVPLAEKLTLPGDPDIPGAPPVALQVYVSPLSPLRPLSSIAPRH